MQYYDTCIFKNKSLIPAFLSFIHFAKNITNAIASNRKRDVSMKIYDKPVLDARKSTYQKLLHSKLLNSNEVNVGYWKSAIYNYAFLRFLISYCEDLRLFGGTKKFGEVCDVLTVANVVAEIQNSGRANDFSFTAASKTPPQHRL